MRHVQSRFVLVRSCARSHETNSKSDTFHEQNTFVSVLRDYSFRLLDLLKTDSRSRLLSLALARNEAGRCPSAEMRKGVPLPFLNRGWASTCETFQSTSTSTCQRDCFPEASSEISASKQAESLQLLKLSPRPQH